MRCACPWGRTVLCDLEAEHVDWHRGQIEGGAAIRWKTLVTTDSEYLARQAAHDAIRLPERP